MRLSIKWKCTATLALSMVLSFGPVPCRAQNPGLSADEAIQAPPAETVRARPTSSTSVQDCIVIDFEGTGNLAPIGTILGSPQIPEIIFGSSWLGLVDMDAGGSGNFANEPSASTVAFFLDQTDISISFPVGVQLVEFEYSAAAQSLPVTVSAFDVDGNLVDRATGSTIGTDYDGAGCSGDPSGNFCLWDQVTLASTSNSIRYITIAGTVSNYFGIDNLRVCIGQCAPPSGQAASSELISIPESCCWGSSSSCLEKTNFAGSWWDDCLLSEIVADSGEKVQLWCIAGILPCDLMPWAGHYELHYFFPDGTHYKVGICPFESGRNRGVLFHAGDNDGNGNPDCFIRTTWTSKDQQVGDRDDDGDGKIDWWVFTYDVVNNSFSKTNYESTDGPGGADPDVVAATDPPLGPVTEAMLDMLISEFEEQATDDDGPMGASWFDPADLNQDGKCDISDVMLFQTALGSCMGEGNFNSDADFNGDGCVTVEDADYLFPPVIEIAIDIKPGSYPNSINKNGKGVIPVAILGSSDFDVTQVDATTLSFEGTHVRVKGNGAPQCSVEDVSGDFTTPEGAPDGHPDLVCQFVDDTADWTVGPGTAALTGNLKAELGGTPIKGTDTINVVQ